MSKTTTSGTGTIVIEGLGEITAAEARAKLAAAKAEANKSAKAREAAAKKIAERKARLVDLRDGTNDSGKNPNLRHNPQLRPETLRAAFPGEQINGRDAKGWVVTIVCETCGTEREINTQDAFQVRFCEEHKAEASKAAAKVRRDAARTEKAVAEVAELSDEEVARQLAELTAAAA